MIKNWQHLCIFGRLASPYIDIDGLKIEHEGKDIVLSVSYDGTYIDYIDCDTGEVLLTQGEDGFPTYKSDWADEEPTLPYQIA